jgi:uncharacterized protein (DUF1778 family)
MTSGKNISVSFRVSQRFKQLLEAAAANEHRSLTNMLETLLFAYCDEHDIDVTDRRIRTPTKSKRSTST